MNSPSTNDPPAPAPDASRALASDEPRDVEAPGRNVVMRFEPNDQLTVVGPTGRVELSVRFTDKGPVLSFEAARFELKSSATIALDCEDIELNARNALRISTGGDLVHEIGGDMRSSVAGHSVHHAKDVDIASTEGEVRVQAASDAWVDGQNVLLNCDREEEMRERKRLAKASR